MRESTQYRQFSSKTAAKDAKKIAERLWNEWRMQIK